MRPARANNLVWSTLTTRHRGRLLHDFCDRGTQCVSSSSAGGERGRGTGGVARAGRKQSRRDVHAHACANVDGEREWGGVPGKGNGGGMRDSRGEACVCEGLCAQSVDQPRDNRGGAQSGLLAHATTGPATCPPLAPCLRPCSCVASPRYLELRWRPPCLSVAFLAPPRFARGLMCGRQPVLG